MLQNKFEMPLDLVVKPSKIFSLYLYSIFSFSIVSIFISSLSISLQLLLVVILFGMTTFILKKQKLNKVTSLKLNSNDEWEIEINNQSFDVELHGECIVTYFLIWLNFTTCNSFGRQKVFHVLLLPDSADKDQLRKLRVRLRFLKAMTEEDTEVRGENIN